MEYKGSVIRIKKCVYDLLSMSDLMEDDDSWDLMGRDLRLKSTFLYCDFSRVISSSAQNQKKSLTDLVNKLFYFIEELDQALKLRSIPLAQKGYNDTAVAFEEVIELLT